jgi:hypothetical protein
VRECLRSVMARTDETYRFKLEALNGFYANLEVAERCSRRPAESRTSERGECEKVEARS